MLPWFWPWPWLRLESLVLVLALRVSASILSFACQSPCSRLLYFSSVTFCLHVRRFLTFVKRSQLTCTSFLLRDFVILIFELQHYSCTCFCSFHCFLCWPVLSSSRISWPFGSVHTTWIGFWHEWNHYCQSCVLGSSQLLCDNYE